MAYMVIATMNYGSADQRAKSIPLLKAHQERTLSGEPGTLRFDFALSIKDDAQVLLQELYENEDAFWAHWKGESMKTISQECRERGIEISINAWHGTTPS
ncbi:MAG: antibiotic biosynthesis monooxygenase [Rhizobiaceae bacterium]